MKFLQISFYFLNGLVLKVVSYFAVCFGILTVSLCFLEFHLWEFFEPWVEAKFLQKNNNNNCFLLPVAWGVTTQHSFKSNSILFVCFLLEV